MTEHEHCSIFTQFLEVEKMQGRVLLFSKLAQDRKTSIQYAMYTKKEGLRPGVPDYLIIIPNKIIFIEMKREENFKISEHQKNWIYSINSNGGYAFVCNGNKNAIDTLKNLYCNK